MSTEKPVPAEGSLLTPIRLIGYVENGGKKAQVWDCRCKCGQIHATIRSRIINGSCKSCGCLRKEQCHEKLENAREAKRLKRNPSPVI